MPEQPELKIKQILLAFDAWGCSHTSLHRAITLATLIKAQIQGLYIEDSDLLQIAELPFAREISFHSAQVMNLNSDRLRRSLRNFSSELQSLLEQKSRSAEIYSTFKIVQGQRIPTILQESHQASIIMLPGNPSWSTQQLQIMHNNPLIAVVVNDSKQGTTLLNIGISLATKEHANILALYTNEDTKRLVTNLMAGTGINFQLHSYDNINSLQDYLQKTKPASVVIADTNPLISTAGCIQQISRLLKCDLIISQSR